MNSTNSQTRFPLWIAKTLVGVFIFPTSIFLSLCFYNLTIGLVTGKIQLGFPSAETQARQYLKYMIDPGIHETDQQDNKYRGAEVRKVEIETNNFTGNRDYARVSCIYFEYRQPGKQWESDGYLGLVTSKNPLEDILTVLPYEHFFPDDAMCFPT
jgi:hypothetical protein